MIGINDLKNGIIVKIDNDPYVVLLVRHLHIGRGASSVQTKIKNLKTGQVLERNFRPADEFEEAEIEKTPAKFIYESKGDYWFHEAGKPQNRFSLKRDDLGDEAEFLKPNLDVQAVMFDEKIIAIELPIKVEYKVLEAPPAVKGNTAQGGTKTVVIEGGAKIITPMFINEGDIIRINTTTGEYAERVEKA
jgi:elongation factor P